MERMKEKKVEYVELFYDLIFVFCISRLTALLHPMTHGFEDYSTLPVYFMLFVGVLQVWIFTTYFSNRFSERRPADYICFFINMFSLYWMADGIRTDWQDGFLVFHISWAILLWNLSFQFLYRVLIKDYTDEDDKAILKRRSLILGIEGLLAFACGFLYPAINVPLSWIPVLFGIISSLLSNRLYSKKPLNFEHFTERVSLLIVVTFGEMVVGISGYFSSANNFYYAIMVFLIVIGLFLTYIFDFYNLLDRERHTTGILYMIAHIPLIISLNHITAAFEIMPNDDVARAPKTLYTMISLGAYFLFFLMLTCSHKEQYQYGRKCTLVHLGIVGGLYALFCLTFVLTKYDPAIGIAVTVVFVYAVLAEMFRYKRQGDRATIAKG